MNRLKSRIAALQSYLGRDSQGLALLKEISNAANENRKKLSFSNEELDRKNLLLREAIDKRDSALSEKVKMQDSIAAANLRIDQLNNKYQQIHSRCDRLQSLVDRYENDFDPPLRDEKQKPTGLDGIKDSHRVVDEAEFARMFNVMRKEIKFAPKPCYVNGRLSFELFDIIDNFSVSDLAKLGRFVASLAMTQMYPSNAVPSVSTEFPLKSNAHGGKVFSDRSLARFAHWFRNNIYMTEIEKKFSSVSTLPRK